MKNKYINVKIWEVEYDSGYTFILMDIVIQDVCRKIYTHVSLQIITLLDITQFKRLNHHHHPHLNSSLFEKKFCFIQSFIFHPRRKIMVTLSMCPNWFYFLQRIQGVALKMLDLEF